MTEPTPTPPKPNFDWNSLVQKLLIGLVSLLAAPHVLPTPTPDKPPIVVPKPPVVVPPVVDHNPPDPSKAATITIVDTQGNKLTGLVASDQKFIVDMSTGQIVLRCVPANAPQPVPSKTPPDQPTPVVEAPPVPVEPGSQKFTVYIVEDSSVVRTNTTASILRDLTQRKALLDRGHVVTTTTTNENQASSATYAKQHNTPLPAMVLYNNATHSFVKSVPLATDLGLSTVISLGG